MRKTKYSLVFIFLALFTLLAKGQNEYQTKYLLGKDLIKNQKYSLAMEVFLPLTKDAEDNPFKEYAHYFYALAGLKGGQLNEARQMLLQLMEKYPHWVKLSEAHYLFSNILFEQEKYREGVKYADLSFVKDIKKDAEQLKEYYAQRMPLDTLIAIQKDLPKDEILANVLGQRLSKLKLNEKDEMLLNFLIQEYKLNIKKTERTGKIKDVYNVAILFPFHFNELKVSTAKRSNQYALEMYEGIKMAVDSLNKKGTKINLYAYDTEKENDKVAKILALPEFKNIDLIIGPVFPNHIPLVSEFAVKNNITFVNPLSANSKLLEGSENLLLFQPVLESMAGEVARLSKDRFIRKIPLGEEPKKSGNKNNITVTATPDSTKNVIIFYGEDIKDSLLAALYRDSITLAGFNVVDYELVSRTTIANLKNILADSLKLTQVSHVFIPTSDQVVAANLISSMEISQQSIPVVTYSSWLEFPLLTYEQFERRKVHFIYPEYVDYNAALYKSFTNLYIENNRTFPDNFTYTGYDLMSLCGKALIDYGTYFEKGLSSKGFIKGKIFQGFDYSNTRYNAYVPVTTFENKKLVVTNPGKTTLK
ncbi:MAG TPA: hypothetical protein VIK89_13305 [Cytophagaceae bacterium]